MSKGKDVVEFRKRIKTALVEAFGGHCQVCGEKHPEFVFDFHHLNPSDKSFNISSTTTTRAKSAYAEEAKKCIMVCANCHRYIENEGINAEAVSCTFDENVYYATIERLARRNAEVVENRVIERKTQNIKKPNREQLKKDLRQMPMVQVGKKYYVSDNAVRKWCVSYGLPSKVSDIKKYSDDEWQAL